MTIVDEKVDILVVNDRPDQLLTLCDMLSPLNENVLQAISGREALRLIMAHDFAVILLDVNMPEMNGFELAELVRQREKSRNTPIIFATATEPSIEGHTRGYALGAVDYIYTPFITEFLLAKVKVFAELHRKTKLIQKQADALQEANRKLVEEIRQRKHTEKALRRAQKDLKQAAEELESRVVMRTIELKQANEQLRQEVDERQKTEQNLVVVLEELRALVEATPATILLLDCEGRVKAWKGAGEAIFGWKEEEVLGCIPPIVLADRIDIYLGHVNAVVKGQVIRGSEVPVQRRDGQILTMSASFGPLFNHLEQVSGVIAVLSDISERRLAELRSLRLASAVEQIAESVCIVDIDKKVHYVNPAHERMTGFSGAELLGQHPCFLETPVQDATFYQAMWAALKQGGVWSGHMTNRKKDQKPYEVEVTASPIKDADGQIINYVFVSRDITREKALENQLRQAQKMEAIGTLAGGIAHDFNNILNSVIGFTEVVLMDIPPENKIREDLHEVLKAGHRAADLVRQILTISRRTDQELTPIDIGPIVKEALKLLRAALPATIEIRPDVRFGLGSVMVDPTQVHQILMNLCTNAKHAMRDSGGVLMVNLERVDLSPEDALWRLEMKPGPYVRLTVSDTGHGIPNEIIDRIFEPYFTTKGKDEGTGLGLSVVHGIVKSFGGVITVYSDVGKGTVFHVYLPLIAQAATEKVPARTKLPLGRERILLVDDEEAVGKVGAQLLGRLGYVVQVCASGPSALQLLKNNPHPFDLVITDQTMPKLTGLELAREIRNLYPNLPVILASGFITEATEEQARALGIKAVLPKPWNTTQLAAAIREVVNSK